MIGMLEEICGQIIFEIIIFGIILILVDAGMSESQAQLTIIIACLLYTSPSPRDRQKSRMPSSA